MSLSDLSARLQTALGDAYRIERELTRGGMSRLFIAEESSLHRKVVVKVLPPEFASEVSAARFRQEIELAANLQHPNILPVLAARTRDDLLYYVIPYVPGESLRHRLTQQGQLPVAEALQILRETADALAHAHAEGIIHRDIKPENILLLGGHAVLTDFGVARALVEARSGERLTETGLAVGTPGYMSPEQVAGDLYIDARADVYSLEVVGYEMLTGKAPFEGPTAQAVPAAHLTATPTALSAVRSDLPTAVSEAIAKALAKNPRERLGTAAEFRDALGVAMAPTRGLPRPGRTYLAVGGAVALGLLAFWLVRRNNTPALDGDLLAIAPFDVVSPALQEYHEGLVTILSRTMDGAGTLRTVSPTMVVRRWTGQADPASASALGHAPRAGLVVFGQVVTTGSDSARITATIYDVLRGQPAGEVEVRDHKERIDRVADSLAVRLLRELSRTRPVGAVRFAALGSSSLPAIKVFLQSEQFYRRGQWDSSLAYARRALELDTGFTLAMRRIVTASWWGNQGGEDIPAVMLRAGAHNRGLAPRESLLVTLDSLWGAQDKGAYGWPLRRRSFATAREATRRYPEDPEVWYHLGELSLHKALDGTRFVSQQETLDAFEHAIRLDSAFAPAYWHAIELAARLGDSSRVRQLAQDLTRRYPTAAFTPAADLVQRLLDPGLSRLPETARALDSANALTSEWVVDATYGLPDAEGVGLRATRAWAKKKEAGANGPPNLAYALATRGHLSEALQSLPSDSHSVARITMETLARVGSIPADSAGRMFDRWVRQGWGNNLIWWAAQGDTAALREAGRREAVRAAKAKEGSEDQAVARYATAMVPAYVYLARHDTAAALRAFESLPDSLCPGCLDRLLVAQLLADTRQDRAADSVLNAGFHPAWFVGQLDPLWYLLRGRVSERLGKREEAVDAYLRVTTQWRNADSILQPYVAEAKAGLARLSAEPRR